jgi:hypothetical protein
MYSLEQAIINLVYNENNVFLCHVRSSLTGCFRYHSIYQQASKQLKFISETHIYIARSNGYGPQIITGINKQLGFSVNYTFFQPSLASIEGSR